MLVSNRIAVFDTNAPDAASTRTTISTKLDSRLGKARPVAQVGAGPDIGIMNTIGDSNHATQAA